MKRDTIMGNNNAAEESAEIAVPSPSEAFASEVASARFTEEDIAKARSQEKAKLYPQLEKIQNELVALRKEKEERDILEAEKAAKRAEREAQREAEKKAKLEEEMNVKQLLKTKEQEWQARLEEERAAREQAFAMLQLEKEYNELQSYRQSRLAQEQDNIIPELLDLVNGNSRDEIEQSIAGLKERSAKIFESVQTANQQVRKEMKGASINASSSGLLDNDLGQRTYSPEDLRNMPMTEYAKNRDSLLGRIGNNRGQGLFGNN
jgi:DNA repair exonuclease SbcCD ATPase subunit